MSAGRSAKDVIILLIVTIVAVGGIAGFGFYSDEVTGYMRLQGWNLNPAVENTREFLKAGAADDATRLQAMISPKAPDLKLVTENGVNYLTVRKYGGPPKLPVKDLMPSADPPIGKPWVVFQDGGTVAVRASYPNAHELEFRWDNTDQGWKVKALSRIKDGE